MLTREEEVVVLGWWAKDQRRISFVHLLQRELGVGLAEAKGLLDVSLRDGAFITIPVRHGRGLWVATEVQRAGAECRVLCVGDGAATKRAHLGEQVDALVQSKKTMKDMRATLVTLAPEMAVPALRCAEEAQRFCHFVERCGEESLSERLRQTATHLSVLYAAALQLPAVEPGADDSEPSVAVPETWSGFGELELYWEVFDPYEDDDAVANTLSDDVLDVYLDVKRGLIDWDAGRRLDAIWSWRFHFGCHWGDHAVDGLRVLQRAMRRVADTKTRSSPPTK